MEGKMGESSNMQLIIATHLILVCFPCLGLNTAQTIPQKLLKLMCVALTGMSCNNFGDLETFRKCMKHCWVRMVVWWLAPLPHSK